MPLSQGRKRKVRAVFGLVDDVLAVEKTAAVKKTPRQAASSVEASGRPSFAIPVGTGMYQ
uniref:Uncharacterized protein n=1 Tax=Peronospora matthiolae TaxID=2874970 RepID=A0AAV1VJJ5_9STRA